MIDLDEDLVNTDLGLYLEYEARYELPTLGTRDWLLRAIQVPGLAWMARLCRAMRGYEGTYHSVAY